MIKRKLDEIVVIDNDSDMVNQIVEKFIKVQREMYNIIVSAAQEKNIRILAMLLCSEKKPGVNIPIIVPVPMGEGKSTLLIDFIKFMHEHDPAFGAIVVKKTLDECRDFRNSVGLRSTEGAPNCEDDYIVKMVRGFNFDECTEYFDKTRRNSYFGNAEDYAKDYDFRLCSGCNKSGCRVKDSRILAKKHRIIAVTHNRLFHSNHSEELMNELHMFEVDGRIQRRKLLVIDEKIDMCSIERINDAEIDKVIRMIKARAPELVKQVEDLRSRLMSLPLSKSTTEGIEVFENPLYNDQENFITNQIIEDIVSDRAIDFNDVKNLLILERLIKCREISVSAPWPPSNNVSKCFSYYEYLDLRSYSWEFDKTLVFDATAPFDLEYRSSDAVLCDDIELNKRLINVYQPVFKLNASKANLSKKSNGNNSSYEKKIEQITGECAAVINGNTGKTLIVVYKEIRKAGKRLAFKEDLINSLKSYDLTAEYEVIHHGEYTTGVNKFSDFDHLIVVGLLNKSLSYYQNKAIAIGETSSSANIDAKAVKLTEMNEYTIDMIQQIGRTAYRRGKIVNVYLFDRYEKINKLVECLEEYFNVCGMEYFNSTFNDQNTKQDGLLLTIYEKYVAGSKQSVVSKYEIKELAGHFMKDTSALRKPEFKNKLAAIGIRECDKNNRQYIIMRSSKRFT